MENKIFEKMTAEALSLGAFRAAVIQAESIVVDSAFRAMCESNACGMYGKCYMCPPDVGDIDRLMGEIGEYKYALVYQTVSKLEDSFDFEGMVDAKSKTYPLAQSLRKIFADLNVKKVLHLGAGGCGVCKVCAKRTGEPCRAPERAMPSLEAYGINVSELARTAGMKYINGQNTVTYFGAVLFSLNENITVTVNGERLSAEKGKTLSELIGGEKPCGGHGKCGKCRVMASGALSEPTQAEKQLLTADELARGIRLSCMTHALGDCTVTTFSRGQANILTAGELPSFALQPVFSKYGMAVDVGTTTVASRLYNARGDLLAQASRLNPQSTHGADVISRIQAAMDGKGRVLAASVRAVIDGMARELADKASINTKNIDGMVITGNTVMLSLLTEQSVEPFSHAPFEAERLFGEVLTAETLELTSLHKDTPVYLPPCISAFVGADTVCAILATDLCQKQTAMLADIGTNGEMVIWHEGKLTACSTAAGPAFEGVGISMGMQGADGAIDKVSIVNGKPFAHVIGDGTPRGICGSGFVDAVACMLDIEALDESGYLEDDPFVIQPHVELTQQDIRMLQLAKSAICAGLITLMKQNGLSSADISTLYMAGGFGNYLGCAAAARIGLLPRELANKARAVGNAALAGASMLLLSADLRPRARELSNNAHVAELSTDPLFSRLFMSGMMLDFVSE